MKKKVILFSMLAAGLYVSLSSNKTGYGSNRTGSHGAAVGCSSCHGSANSGVTIAIELDSAGVPVTRYKPGMTYTLKLTGTNGTAATNLNGFGGQLSIVRGIGTSSSNAGTLSAPTTGSTIRTGTGSILYIEHSTRISPAIGTGGSGTTYVLSATWVAPVAGSGTVTAFGLINAVNCNNSDGSGDYWNNGSAAFTELPTGALEAATVVEADAKMYPNPVSNVLNFSGYSGHCTITDISGKLVFSGNVSGNTSINTSSWTNGTYIVSINGTASKTIIKQ